MSNKQRVLHEALLNYINLPSNIKRNALIKAINNAWSTNFVKPNANGPWLKMGTNLYTSSNNPNNRMYFKKSANGNWYVKNGQRYVWNYVNKKFIPMVYRNSINQPYKRTFSNGRVLYTQTNNIDNKNYFTRNNLGRYFKNNKQYHWNKNLERFRNVIILPA